MEDFWLTSNNTFENHLKSSSRIFFSGSYGIGKTTFLKNFFQEEDILDKYICFHLYPINYSVAKTEDVIDLLKYDILFEIFKIYGEDSDTISDSDELTKKLEYLSENPKKFLIRFLKMIPKIGRSVKEIENEIKSLIEDFEEFSKREFKDNEIDDFIRKIESSKGSIYSNDFINEYLNQKLETIKIDKKDSASKKETVLILDDIDRIDPTHVFRLLNVFSTLYDDSTYSGNKLNFDKIVVVADYLNLKSIYQHVFGINANFEGYIDKFYSDNIYKLTFLESLKNQYASFNLDTHFVIDHMIFQFSSLLFESDKLNFRQLNRLKKINSVDKNDLSAKVLIKILSSLYSFDEKETINSLISITPSFDDYIYNSFYKHLICFIIADYSLTENKRIVKSSEEEHFSYTFAKSNRKLGFKYRGDYGNRNVILNAEVKENLLKSQIWEEFIYYLEDYIFLDRNKTQ